MDATATLPPDPEPLITLARWILLLGLLFSAAVAVSFLLHYFDRASRDEGEPLPLATYLRIYAQEWWYSLAALALYPAGWLPRVGPRRFEPGGGPPVVLLHGYGMNRSCWFAFYWRLRRLGLRNVYPLNLKPRFGSIETIGADLAAELTEIHALGDGRDVHVVAHSMAGIVSRWCLEADPALPVAQVITIGSPHRGTRIAVFGLGEAAAQLRPGSELLLGLSAEPRVRLVSLYSELDSLVVPSDSAHFGEVILPCRDGGHLTLIYSARSFDRLRPYLPAPDPSPTN